VKLLEDVSMMEADNAVLMVARFEVKHANDSLGTLISAFPGVVLDGSAIEVEPPVGAAQPRVVRWRDPEQNTYEADGDQSVIVPAESKGIWEVVMLAPEDVMIQLELRTESIY
jgi:hypothetical protein